MAEGPIWNEQRRFALRHLRDFGFGKSWLESFILDEVKELILWINQQEEKPISLENRFSLAAGNTIWTIFSGQRYNHDDPKLVGIIEQMHSFARTLFGGGIKIGLILLNPRIAKYFCNWSGWNSLINNLAPLEQLFEETIHQHQRTLQGGHPRDFIDIYLQEIQRTVNPTSIFHSSTGEKALLSVMADYFAAGTDTSSHTLLWATLYLLHYTGVQTKLQEEIDKVVGKSRLPSLTDRNRMPYAEAFIMEVLRKSSIAALTMLRSTTENVEFHGYDIPKCTSVVASLYSTHHDPDVWGDPENFRPERFLSRDGTQVVKHESLIPFSTGKRQCPGKDLARDQLFLFITSLAQSFTFANEAGKPKPTLRVNRRETGSSLKPHSFVVVMKKRL